ncbi:MAG: hypothetical protein PHU21_05345, partial [Elusimicrobia bacterium]|nr:hypothetical protein [Elusimicrobiota bacterium]
RKAVYKTPAEIENILKEAALVAVRDNRELINYKDLSTAIERIELGVAHRLTMTEHEREMVAYHEAGHLIVLYLSHPTDDVFKASIIQRAGSLGVVHHIPREELHLSDRNRLLGHIKTSLGGYVAEKLRYGVTTSGVSSDFTNAMAIAHQMVWSLGMGGDGLIGDFSVIPSGQTMRGDQLSEQLKGKLNMETQRVLHDCLVEVEQVLRAESRILDRFAAELVRRDELDYDEIVSIFLEYGKPPRPIPLPLSDLPPSAGPLSLPPGAAPL